MNRIYRLILDRATGRVVITSAHSRSSRKGLSAALVLAGLGTFPLCVLADTQGGKDEVTAGGYKGSSAWGVGACSPKNSQGVINEITAYGVDAGCNAKGERGTYLGYQAGYGESGNQNTAIGQGAGRSATGDSNSYVGVGAGAYTSGSLNAAFGNGAGSSSNGTSNIAIGGYAGYMISGSNNIAIGFNAGAQTTAGQGALAIQNTVSIGNSSVAKGSGAIALGVNSAASGANSVALGYGSNDGGASNVVSIGNGSTQRRLTNAAAGTLTSTSTDGINGSQLYATNNAVATALGGGSTLNADGTIKAPSYTVGGTTMNNVGGALTNLDGRITQNTTNITTLTNNLNSGAAGLVRQDSTTRTLTVGKDTDGTSVNVAGTAGARTVTGLAAAKLGASSADAVNGSQLYATNSAVTTALGGGASVNADGTIKAPSYTVGGITVNNVGSAITNIDGRIAQYASNLNTVVNNISNGTVGLVQQDASTRNLTVARNTDGTTISLTGTAGARTVTGLAAATLSASSAEAVNGSQLYATNNALATALGGGTTMNPDGTVKAPSYAVGGATVNNVGGAITNIDGRVTQNTSEINTLASNLGDGTIGLVQQDAITRNLTVGKDTDGAVINVSGTNGTRVMTGLTAGALNASSSDAVNGSQLYATNNAVTTALGGGAALNPDGTIKAPSYIVGGTTVNNIGSAVTNIDGRVTQNTTDISTLTNDLGNGTVGLVQQDAITRNLTVGSGTDGLSIDVTGTAGTRAITGVTAGTLNESSVEAVNGSQLYATNNAVTTALGGGAALNPDGTIKAPSYTVGGTTVNNVGDAVTNIDGRVTQNTSDISTINNTLTDISAGAGIKYFHSNSSLADSIASGEDAVAIGGNAQAGAQNAVALGANSVASRANTVSVGASGAERQITNVAAGTEDTDAVNFSQLKNAGLVDNEGATLDAVVYASGTGRSVINLAGSNGTVINNVADGQIARYSHEAVNGGQLAQLRDALSGQLASMGMRVTDIEDSIISYLHIDPRGPSAGDISGNEGSAGDQPGIGNGGGDGFENSTAIGTNSSVTGNNSTAVGANAAASAQNAVAIGAAATVTQDNAVAIGAGSVADRANSVSVGAAGNTRQITNVSAGSQATDAVNVSQLSAVTTALGGGASVSATDGSVIAPTYHVQGGAQNNVGDAISALNQGIDNNTAAINSTARSSYSGIAAATALTMIPEVDPGKRISFGIGAATYKGYQAVAMGGTARITENIKVKSGVGISSAGTAFGIGGSYQW